MCCFTCLDKIIILNNVQYIHEGLNLYGLLQTESLACRFHWYNISALNLPNVSMSLEEKLIAERLLNA